MAEPFAPTKPMSHKLSISSSAFLFTISLSLFSFSIYFLSFKDTIFWFFLSNAIIFLIAAAADSDDATSSSRHKPDLYDDYLKTTRSRFASPIPAPDLITTQPNKDPESLPEDKKETESFCEDPVMTNYKKDSDTADTERNGGEKVNGGRCVRSNSKKAIVAVDGTRKKALGRSNTGNGGRRSDDGDFSALSNEDLNKRVEEFIRRFNREIWLQQMRERSIIKQI